jgi:hypothetical protein
LASYPCGEHNAWKLIPFCSRYEQRAKANLGIYKEANQSNGIMQIVLPSKEAAAHF